MQNITFFCTPVKKKFVFFSSLCFFSFFEREVSQDFFFFKEMDECISLFPFFFLFFCYTKNLLIFFLLFFCSFDKNEKFLLSFKSLIMNFDFLTVAKMRILSSFVFIFLFFAFSSLYFLTTLAGCWTFIEQGTSL